MLGLDLLTCVFLTTVDAILFPLFSICLVIYNLSLTISTKMNNIVSLALTFQENGKGKLLCIYLTSFILLGYGFGVLISQPEIPLSTGGMLSKLSGESALALMSLLGASIMPHNFYLHSSIVQVSLSLSVHVYVCGTVDSKNVASSCLPCIFPGIKDWTLDSL